jgi:hypothetical protein
VINAGTAVRTAVSAGGARPSGPKLCVQSAYWYVLIYRGLTPAGQRIFRADGGRPLRGRRLADRLFSLCWQ